MVEVTAHTVLSVGESGYCVVLLKEKGGSRYLPVWVRVHQAQPIALWMQNVRLGRPHTHDLLLELADKLGLKLVGVNIYDVEKGALLSRIILRKHGEEIALECRASDAIAVAVKKGVPITVTEEIIRIAGIVVRHEQVESSVSGPEQQGDRLSAFRDFIESLDLDGL